MKKKKKKCENKNLNLFIRLIRVGKNSKEKIYDGLLSQKKIKLSDFLFGIFLKNKIFLPPDSAKESRKKWFN